MKLLVTGALQATPQDYQALSELGCEITAHQDERSPVTNPEAYDGIICNNLFLSHDVRDFPNLTYIQAISAGLDRIPVDYAQQHGIAVRNAAGVYAAPMAEWTILKLLELYKHSRSAYENQSAALWNKDRSWLELGGKKACIVGFGAYGQEIAKRLKAFDLELSVVNRTKKSSPFVDRFFDMNQLNEALCDADVVILAIALTPDTQMLFGRAQFDAMKEQAVFINAARGALVEEEALIEALQTKLLGAALDVFVQEPLPQTNPLWRLPNVLITPHNSFVGEGTHARLMEIVTGNLQAFLSERPE